MNRIVLYYSFVPLPDPEAIRLWQLTLCESLGLRGRIIISDHGINGTVGGPLAQIKQYVKRTREYLPLKKMDIKYSEGSAEDFPRLSVKVRDEIVTFGAPGEIKVDDNGVVGAGEHLRPEEVHELVDTKRAAGQEVVFFDGRNAFEAQIGKFKNAIVPEVETTREFVAELDSGKYDHLKDTPIVTYCTGGIRCEVLSSLMKNRGFNEVYQIKGGIVRYGETYADQGLWEGSLYVFDKRMHTEFSEEASIIGRCAACSNPTSNFENCANLACRKLTLYCEQCVSAGRPLSCPEGCQVSA